MTDTTKTESPKFKIGQIVYTLTQHESSSYPESPYFSLKVIKFVINSVVRIETLDKVKFFYNGEKIPEGKIFASEMEVLINFVELINELKIIEVK